MKYSRYIIVFILLFYLLDAYSQELFKDEYRSNHDRIIDLLSRLTIEEKVSLLIATSPGIPRLQIDKYYHGNEALHGVIRPGRFTVFPQAIGLSATWNTKLMNQVANVISDEARARWNELYQGKNQKNKFTDLLTFWSPNVNMARDPRWGRTPETYGEDPFLTGKMGVEFIKGLQGNNDRYLKVVATPKHFAANNEEHNRFTCNPQISEKQLREYYFPAFERCVKDGKAASIMSAYNALNDIPCTLNPWLLTKILREEWGFDGYVVSDCGAPALLVNAHKYVKTKESAATLCIKAGLDLECGDNVYMEPLIKAYELGMVTKSDIDTAAYRVLNARMKLGLFDSVESNPYTKISPSIIGSLKHQEVALKAAKEGIVLLKNSNGLLPLDKNKLKTVGIVGINADNCEFGDYSGMPVISPVSVLEGVKNKIGDKVKVLYAPWKSARDGMELIHNVNFPGGLIAEYYDNMELKGKPKVRKEEWINFEPSNQAPDPFIPTSPLSIRWYGKLRPDISGKHTFSLTSDDGCKLYINEELIIDSWRRHTVRVDTASIFLEAGVDYDIKVEYYDDRDYAVAKLQWKKPEIKRQTRLEMFGEAGKIVKRSDVVIAVLGINKSIEREGKDRDDINLPDDQEEFIREIYKINPNIVVVLVAGSPLSINWINDNIPAIINAWYPGERGGDAIAEVLWGDYNPAGRLPITYYKDINDIPEFDNYDITKGRTYQYFKGIPLYPFGYGLSYTDFSYSNLNICKDELNGVLDIIFDIKNVGKYSGDEVPQVYLSYEGSLKDKPIKQLKGFTRTHIKQGEKQKINISIDIDDIRFWNEKESKFYTPTGTYKIMIGSSSEDIRLEGNVVL